MSEQSAEQRLKRLSEQLKNYGIYLGILLNRLGGKAEIPDSEVELMTRKASNGDIRLDFVRDSDEEESIISVVEVAASNEQGDDDG